MIAADEFVVSAAVEGLMDEAVLRRIGDSVNVRLGAVYGRNGKKPLLQRLNGYNQAALFSPWVVLVDLDADGECAAAIRSVWLPAPAPAMCFRIAVREIEAWLLADRERIAAFLGVATSRVPVSPEALPDPKQVVVSLASQSQHRTIRADLAPRPGSGRSVGAAYTSRMMEFVSSRWRPEVAAESSDSLSRCLRCLQRLVEAARPS